jgi:hypothetical protein
MVERRIVVDTMRTHYQGVLNIVEFMDFIDHWLREKGYYKKIGRTDEKVFKENRQVEIEWEPWKKVDENAKIVIQMKFLFTNVKDVVVEKDGMKKKLQQAKISVTFMGLMESDYEHKWEKRPFYFLIFSIIDQFVWKINSDKYFGLVAEDCTELRNEMKAFLNLYRF